MIEAKELWNANNAEKCRAYRKKYRLQNPEKVLALKKAYRDSHKEQVSKYNREWHLGNKAKAMFLGARNRAAKRGLEFSIDLEDIVIPDMCPILKIPIVLDSVNITRGSPSLDRIDNTKGYVKGNVQVISHKANTAKNDLNPEDLLNLARWSQEMFT